MFLLLWFLPIQPWRNRMQEGSNDPLVKSCFLIQYCYDKSSRSLSLLPSHVPYISNLIQHCTVLVITWQWSTVQYSEVKLCTVQWSDMQFCTIQWNEVLYITVKWSYVQCITAKLSTVVKYSTVQWTLNYHKILK